MNAQQLLQKAILLKAVEFGTIQSFDDGLGGDQVDELYNSYDRYDELADAWCEVRYDGIDCNLPTITSSRHYEVDAKAINIDGKWVKFDFYYGGGKHGDPDEYNYIEDAVIVDCTQEEITVIKYTFSQPL